MVFFIILKIQKRYELTGWRVSLLYLLYLAVLFPGFLKLTFVAGYLLALEVEKSRGGKTASSSQFTSV